MSVWYCIPSKRPPEEADKVLKLWRAQGYKIALFTDEPDFERIADLRYHGVYNGYARASNALVKLALDYDPQADWVVLGGDDVEPDAKHTAQEIAEQCSNHFLKEAWENSKPSGGGDSRSLISAPHILVDSALSTFGVMQPTGDRWGDGPQARARFGEGRGANIDRVCGSPWVGRQFALRINQGRGPLWPEYAHCFEDEELQHVAIRYGVLWQRRDLVHLHRHWGREEGGKMPEFLREANSPEHWSKYGMLFKMREAAGFPGSEPL